MFLPASPGHFSAHRGHQEPNAQDSLDRHMARPTRWPSALEPLKHPMTEPPAEIDIGWLKVSGDLWGRMSFLPGTGDHKPGYSSCPECRATFMRPVL